MDSIARAFGSTTAVEKTRKEQDSSQLGAGARRSGFFAGKQKPNTTIADGDAGDEPLSTDTDSGLTAHRKISTLERRDVAGRIMSPPGVRGGSLTRVWGHIA